MENKLDALLIETKTNKSTSMTTNPISELNKIGDMQPAGSGVIGLWELTHLIMTV